MKEVALYEAYASSIYDRRLAPHDGFKLRKLVPQCTSTQSICPTEGGLDAGFYAGHMVDFAAHLWQSLREVGRMENAIMLSYDLHSCQTVIARGIPCFLDRWSKQPSELPGASPSLAEYLSLKHVGTTCTTERHT